MGVAASPAKSGRVWATIEAEETGLYRSDDGGTTWELATDNRDIQARPWYYQHVFADPQDAAQHAQSFDGKAQPMDGPLRSAFVLLAAVMAVVDVVEGAARPSTQ